MIFFFRRSYTSSTFTFLWQYLRFVYCCNQSYSVSAAGWAHFQNGMVSPPNMNRFASFGLWSRTYHYRKYCRHWRNGNMEIVYQLSQLRTGFRLQAVWYHILQLSFKKRSFSNWNSKRTNGSSFLLTNTFWRHVVIFILDSYSLDPWKFPGLLLVL